MLQNSISTGWPAHFTNNCEKMAACIFIAFHLRYYYHRKQRSVLKMPTIIDISHHQDPVKINYDTLAKQVDLVIIRTQYGSNVIDKHYKTHHQAFQKRNIPTAAHAWVRGINVSDMEKEAADFYERTKNFHPTCWFLDVEEKSMKNMRQGVSAYLQKLRALGAEKTGVYIAHHHYQDFNIKLSEADAVWLPHYGSNNGKINSEPKFPCDIHQYTDKGKLKGYAGPLDLNRLVGSKKLDFFTETSSTTSDKKVVKDSTSHTGKRIVNKHTDPVHFYDTPRWKDPTGTFLPKESWTVSGKYQVEGSPMYEVKNSKGKLFYITANDKYVQIETAKSTSMFHEVKQGDTVSE